MKKNLSYLIIAAFCLLTANTIIVWQFCGDAENEFIVDRIIESSDGPSVGDSVIVKFSSSTAEIDKYQKNFEEFVNKAKTAGYIIEEYYACDKNSDQEVYLSKNKTSVTGKYLVKAKITGNCKIISLEISFIYHGL